MDTIAPIVCLITWCVCVCVCVCMCVCVCLRVIVCVCVFMLRILSKGLYTHTHTHTHTRVDGAYTHMKGGRGGGVSRERGTDGEETCAYGKNDLCI